MFLRTAQPHALALQRGPKTLLAACGACRIQRIAPADAFQHKRGVHGASCDRAYMIEGRRQGKNAMHAHAPKRGLETYNAAQGGWNANGTAGIAANGRNTQARSYGGRRASARASRDAIRLPRISYRAIMRILRSHPVREFVQIRLAEHNSAGATQLSNYGGIFRRQEVAQDKRAHRRAKILRPN